MSEELRQRSHAFFTKATVAYILPPPPPPPSSCTAVIEHQIDFADVFQGVVLEVDELLRTEVEHRLTVGDASGADDVGAGLACELLHTPPGCRRDTSRRGRTPAVLPTVPSCRSRESGDHSGQLVAGDRRCSVTVAAIGPGRGPRHLSRDESRRMNLNDDVVYRCRRLGPLHQLHPGRSRGLVRHNDCLHRPPPVPPCS
jgi:hypothetical protein